jgi:hypothetical protein
MELKGKFDQVSRPLDGCAFMHRRMHRCQEQTSINLMAPASSFFVTIVSNASDGIFIDNSKKYTHTKEAHRKTELRAIIIKNASLLIKSDIL